MNRAERINITKRKYISRIKKRLYQILIPCDDGYKIPETWKDAEKNSRWVKMLKHNKIYGRSTMNVLEKHFKVKKLRQESKDIINEQIS